MEPRKTFSSPSSNCSYTPFTTGSPWPSGGIHNWVDGDAVASAAELAQVLVKAAANLAVVRTLVAKALAVVARAELLPGRAARRDAVVVGVVAQAAAVAQAAEAATRSRALRGSGEGPSCPIRALVHGSPSAPTATVSGRSTFRSGSSQVARVSSCG